MANITKKQLKNEIKEINTLIKAYEVLEYGETVVALELNGVIYRKGLNLFYNAYDYLEERNDLEYSLKDLNRLLEDLKRETRVFRVECLIAYIKGYIGL